jgi:small-conductance mechanosensitive channel
VSEGQVEQLKQREDVKRALKQTATNRDVVPAKAEATDKVWLGTHVFLLLGLAAFHFLLRLRFLSFAGKYLPLLQRVTLGAMAIVLVLATTKLVQIYIICRIDSAVSRYNLARILRLITALIIVFILLSILFANWYTAVISLGFISVILGFALQTPVTSFIGWIYILVREPYRVGDRIKIGNSTGDVIDVSYLDTTLWEFGGDFLSTDHPSGRIIKFPNSSVLNSHVYNYSWPLFPYIWNEIKFQIAYQSDLEFVSKTMREVVEEELGQTMTERVETFRQLLAQTPVDQLQVRAHPSVLFRVDENTWIEAIVRYLVTPREAGRIKTRLIPRLLTKLNEAPDKVMFPNSNAR